MYKIMFWVLGILVSQVCSAQYDKKDDANLMNASRKLRQLIQRDPHRPTFHFANPEGIAMPFDPNGGIYWNGKYHLGFIYQSLQNGKREHFWGHAVTRDLFHWTLYPDMLDVKPGDVELGIFSGGTFLSREGVPHIIYHGEGANVNLIAYSRDRDLRNWVKFEGNPVLVTPAKGSALEGKYRAWDPECWFDKKTDHYYQIAGGEIAGLFKSKDMYKWDYIGDFIDRKNNRLFKYEDISCPDFFSIGDKDILLFISHQLGTQYYIGKFEKDKYTIEKHGRMNWPGGTFFAPEQLVDDKGRNIIWGWVLERKPAHLPNYGWSGIMSLPRVLTLSKSGEMQINPPEEIKNIRLPGGLKEKPGIIAANTEKVVSMEGTSLEIKVDFKGAEKSPYGVKVFCSPDGREETIIQYDPVAKEIIIDFIKSSFHNPVEMVTHVIVKPEKIEGYGSTTSRQRAPFELKKGEQLQLDIFIDRSIIEVFANGRQCVTQVVYPELKTSTQVKLFATGEPVVAGNLEVYEMSETNSY
ncbi:MAG: glycoside hydrolase family 32 protein [Chitinophagaceae bacterium]|nr:glycoside hydrolase family 32 protein [Chitinophagaceae bacterium]